MQSRIFKELCAKFKEKMRERSHSSLYWFTLLEELHLVSQLHQPRFDYEKSSITHKGLKKTTLEPILCWENPRRKH